MRQQISKYVADVIKAMIVATTVIVIGWLVFCAAIIVLTGSAAGIQESGEIAVLLIEGMLSRLSELFS
ncbi:hypothetical protein [Mycolicibacterium alvei]|uniref:Uncharacterized protein n=1 Tax=Mycolicibacterium alvei TaxID=67081 RepID=A0A6N4V416_9MYCO|nr:hypothetical protein [Mycolicibacterium alvei]MCV6998828.1 hypothetical protein [Mycolicibacterium alvei]BBX30401.1 hypothetical protein MALV_55260 [Mycolicibacterium alvei]